MPADYPDGVNTSGPTISKLLDQPTEFKTTVFEFEDGGVDVNVQPCGFKKWTLEYDGLTESEITTLRTHFNACKGATTSFNFYHRRDATLYPNVFYVEFKIGRHRKKWSTPVEVTLGSFL